MHCRQYWCIDGWISGQVEQERIGSVSGGYDIVRGPLRKTTLCNGIVRITLLCRD